MVSTARKNAISDVQYDSGIVQVWKNTNISWREFDVIRSVASVSDRCCRRCALRRWTQNKSTFITAVYAYTRAMHLIVLMPREHFLSLFSDQRADVQITIKRCCSKTRCQNQRRIQQVLLRRTVQSDIVQADGRPSRYRTCDVWWQFRQHNKSAPTGQYFDLFHCVGY